MKANEFVKWLGLERSVELLAKCPLDYEFIGQCGFAKVQWNDFVDKGELKRLVESHELVKIHGYESSREIVANAPSDDHFYSWTLGGSGVRDKTVNIGELRKAIADVESCMGVSSGSN